MYFIKIIVYYCLEAVLLIMLIGAVLSWIRPRPNRFTDFINEFTATLCFPIRQLLMRFEFVRMCPLDISFMITWFVILLMQRLVL